MRCRYLASPSGRGDYLHLEIRENVTEELVLEFDTDNVAENVIKVEEETLGHNGPIVLEKEIQIRPCLWNGNQQPCYLSVSILFVVKCLS
ncbi:uncharacterized protein LOC111368627 isoform X2 [Olea europaea var. sylvestris]|uniref:uncharacterized protein LOC111368627 isoform X2 n=1 Tax=Olea europaea var. sylvestris TaxID=158386 RepID=UPI000C1CD720|nr:uncharacterized protein LOC111368627 isoform X2 [Olea europaea var. sylvestris]